MICSNLSTKQNFNFPRLSSPWKQNSYIPWLSRFSMTCANPVLPDLFQCNVCLMGNPYLNFETLNNNKIWKQKSVFKVNLKSRFCRFPSLLFNWEIQRRSWKTVLVNISLVDITYASVCETAVLKNSFVQISQRNGRKENQWAVFSVLKFIFWFHIRLQIQINIFQFNAPLTWILKSCFYSTAVVKIYITQGCQKVLK